MWSLSIIKEGSRSYLCSVTGSTIIVIVTVIVLLVRVCHILIGYSRSHRILIYCRFVGDCVPLLVAVAKVKTHWSSNA